MTKYTRISVFDINNTKGYKPKYLKKEYSGLLNHWRKVKHQSEEFYIKNNFKCVEYQFAWKQKLVDDEYPDFNYGFCAMICKIVITPDYRATKTSGWKQRPIPYMLHLYFDSADDDIMYELWGDFDTFESANYFSNKLMHEFELLFRTAYKNKSSICSATYDKMNKMFNTLLAN